jgi:hypothetical protein
MRRVVMRRVVMKRVVMRRVVILPPTLFTDKLLSLGRFECKGVHNTNTSILIYHVKHKHKIINYKLKTADIKYNNKYIMVL